jgi:predicted ATPase/DNA-binding CsgD family transcriptional regulator
LTSFVGRRHEVAAVSALLRRAGVRLVTLTGPGGAGKTRLALRVTEEVEAWFADGAAFVDLASVRDPELVVSTIAQALGVREMGDRPPAERLVDALRDRHLLLVLDNFEHVAEAGPLVPWLLAGCPTVKALITSRAALRLSGERVVPVEPLGLPDPSSPLPLSELAVIEAVALFVDRAQAARPDFALSEANAPSVAEAVRRLDGLPLAVELAAAKARLLPPEALLSRLAQRLPLLAGGPRDAPARLRTMHSAIAWSHDLLSREEQTLFRRFAVFVGGFTLEAAEAVAGDFSIEVFAGVEALADQSLLRSLGGDAEPRFAMLETVREFGLAQLEASGEAAETRRRHAEHFLELTETVEPRLRRAEQGGWLARLEAEHDNLRAALSWGLAVDTATALRLAGNLHWFWYLRGHWSEGRRWLEDALVRGDAPTRTAARMKALAGAGILAFALGDHTGARDRLEESAAIGRSLGDPSGTAYALHFLEMGALYVGDRAAARRLAESVALFRKARDAWGLATALCSQGIAAIRLGEPAAAPLVEESLVLAHELGDAWSLARALNYTGELARLSGEDERARARYEESLALYREIGHRDGAARVLHNLGHTLQHLGDLRRAAEYFAEALAVGQDHGDRWNLAHYLAGLAGMALELGDPVRAVRLLGAASGMIEAAGGVPWPVERAEHDRILAATRVRLGEEAFAAAWAAGRALRLEGAVAEAADVASAGLRMLPSTSPSERTTGRLTQREVEVLRLLAAGKSNPEIGAVLFISPRTAQTHVSNILAKLGVASRAEAAAVAIRDGLL